MSNEGQEQKVIDAVKAALEKEFGKDNINASYAQLAKIAQQAFVEKRFEEAKKILLQCPADTIKSIVNEADQINRQEYKQKYFKDFQIAVESKIVDHALAVVNEQYNQYASPEEMKEALKLLDEETYCYYQPQHVIITKQLAVKADPEYAKENNIVYLSKNQRKKLAKQKEREAKAQ